MSVKRKQKTSPSEQGHRELSDPRAASEDGAPIEFNQEFPTFHTVEAPAEVEVDIKKSRFIGRVEPIWRTEDAEARLAEIRERHKTATHNCFAWRVGLGVPVERFSDDGEPSGTAGRPILEVLRRRPILNALVVVTRYFGGTLLGANGLIRAYADGCAAAIDAATVLTCVQMRKLSVVCDYSVYGKLEYELAASGVDLVEKTYQADVRFSLWVRAEACPDVVHQLTEWSSGQARVTAADPEWVGLRPDGTRVFGVWPG
ncbi:MAG: YigZ family protein [Alicyclobacillus sp.]|nr:YigZ family protein [Alicyclobacillus sp.]